MAIAWLLAESFIKQKEKVIEYLKNNKLDNFTHNKAIQKIIDSYRVSQEEKEFVY
jgi:3-methyladenine DNA glycosylase AlkD